MPKYKKNTSSQVRVAGVARRGEPSAGGPGNGGAVSSGGTVRGTGGGPIQLIEQQRAAFALAQVQQHLASDGFRPYVRRLPAMIQSNGLGQAMAFYASRDDAHRVIYRILGEWLCAPGQAYAGCSDLMQGITQADMHAYRHAQAEAQALLVWLKKFAEALCPKKGDEPPARSGD